MKNAAGLTTKIVGSPEQNEMSYRSEQGRI